MREDRTLPRGEAGRVAQRVRALLAETADPADDAAAAHDAADGAAARNAIADVDARAAEGWDAEGWDAEGWDGDTDVGLRAGDDLLEDGRPGFRRPPMAHGRPAAWDRLLARVPVRLDPGRRGALAVGVAVLLAAVVTGVWLMSSRPQAVPVSQNVPSIAGAAPLVGTDGAIAASSTPSAAPSSTLSSRLVVDVAGKVRHPGVYRLAVGSRVDDAVRAAGGAVGHVDLSGLNLAALLVDGQQVAVGVPAAAGAPVGGSVGGSDGGSVDGATAAIVDLNTATLEQLETLPGVGPVLGQHILDYRTTNGSFSSIDQLNDVSGIGDITFADLEALVTV